jgi:CHAT domain-containing protein
LEQSQQLAANYAKRFRTLDPEWTSRFIVLEAQSAAWRGMYESVIEILTPPLPIPGNVGLAVQRLSLLGTANTHLHEFAKAKQEMEEASYLCSATEEAACGGLLRAKGGLAIELGEPERAYELYIQSLAVARRFKQPMDEASSLMNLGRTCFLEEKLDEGIDWTRAASRLAASLHADDIRLSTLGNLGWAYYKLGDSERALAMYAEAERSAIALGDIGTAVVWLTASGHVYQDSDNLALAAQSHREALKLAEEINSKGDIITALEDLAHVSVETGRVDEADAYIKKVTPLINVNENRLDMLDVMLAQGKIAAAKRDNAKAEQYFRDVEHDPASQTSMRLGAEHELARLYESQGDTLSAEGMYKTALATFEGARNQLKNEDSKLPFLTNATSLYDDYIHFLLAHGRTDEALITADQSRAQTLAQGLGQTASQQTSHSAAISPRAVARKAGATLLFYWLGEKQSYLWAITPQKISLLSLPPQKQINLLIERYRKALLGAEDPLESNNATGQALYTMLVAPASSLIQPGAPVMVLADGALSQLNFETLIVPGANAANGIAARPHYWIEDATLLSAPSLSMLAAAKPMHVANRNLLLLGDAVSPDENYPELPYASVEMKQIERHFGAREQLVFARSQATPEAYLSSNPKNYSYIHFVSHGVASRADPLDSAIILSRTPSQSTAQEDSFKLYAREVMRHPIDARLVTISACYGSGTRAYAGEGLVGLSWAFLRAGAHNVVGALWEANDESSPQLMDSMYQGLQEGKAPEAALRTAKLALLHSQNKFRKPYYWAPFQIYTRL